MKKDNFLKLFLKGMIIGLGIIFPISASYLALGLGVYDRLLEDINNLSKVIKKEFKFLFSIGMGIITSVIISCVLVKFTLKMYPVATYLLFAGLILGGIPILLRKTEKKYNVVNFIWLIIGIIMIGCLSFVGTNNDIILTSDIAGFIKIFLAGALAAGTMMIPGVSGSAILVVIGFYEPMLSVISNIVKLNNVGPNMAIALIFILGMVLGIFIVSRIMGYLLKKHKIKTYFAIVGIVLASAINIFVILSGYNLKNIQLLIGIILFVIGFIISFKYLKEE